MKEWVISVTSGPVLLPEGNERQTAWSAVGISAGVYGQCVVSQVNTDATI